MATCHRLQSGLAQPTLPEKPQGLECKPCATCETAAGLNDSAPLAASGERTGTLVIMTTNPENRHAAITVPRAHVDTAEGIGCSCGPPFDGKRLTRHAEFIRLFRPRVKRNDCSSRMQSHTWQTAPCMRHPGSRLALKHPSRRKIPRLQAPLFCRAPDPLEAGLPSHSMGLRRRRRLASFGTLSRPCRLEL